MAKMIKKRLLDSALPCAILCYHVLGFANGMPVSLPLIPHRSREAMRRRLATPVTVKNDHPHKYYRRNHASGAALQVGALYQGYGTHYVDLWVGTPPQRQTLIVDTGSGMTGFPCSDCYDCGQGYHVDRRFLEDKSTTFKKVPCSECFAGVCNNRLPNANCSVRMHFKEGSSWSAFEAHDVVYMGGPHDHGLFDEPDDNETFPFAPNRAISFAFDMVFGCQTRMTGLFKTQLADGIMGMDTNRKSTFWAQAHNAKVLDSRAFALCFTRQPSAHKNGTEAGAMTLGGYNKLFHNTPLVYSTTNAGRSKDVGFFDVHVRKVYLQRGGTNEQIKVQASDGVDIVPLTVHEDELNRGGVIVDSGTTSTYFHRSIAKAFKEVFEQMTGMQYSHEDLNLTKEEVEALPTILFQLAGDASLNKRISNHTKDTAARGLARMLDPKHPYDVVVAFPPSHYMEFDERKGTYSAQFYYNEQYESVFGANAMMGHDVFFDIENGRIGWAESDCDYTRTVMSGFQGIDHGNEIPDEQEGVMEFNTCSDPTCQGMVLAAMVVMCMFGLGIGRFCYNAQSSKHLNPPTSENFNVGSLSCCDHEERERLVPAVEMMGCSEDRHKSDLL